jgi:hypothetical protein
MVGAISADPSVRYINAAVSNIQSSTAAIASGSNGYSAATNVSTSYNPAATTDTSDLTGITNPDDPDNLNPPNVSYNQVGPVSTSTPSGNGADIGAESTALATASTQLSLSVDAAKHKNDQKKQILDILA